MPYKAQPEAHRFWDKVRVTYYREPGCWPWVASKNDKGYGKFMVKKGRFEVASRVAWRLSYGSIPEGLQVLHRCDNPACVRPTHLFLGTQVDNMRDMRAKGRWKYSPRDQSGERNPSSIISDSEVRQMLAEIADGEGPVSVARKHGIKYRTFWAIRKRKTTLH